jgi:propanol-preferring alcohol dehydrogenase
MLAMVLERVGAPLQPRQLETPRVGPGEVLLRVHCCGVCRTDLHIVDGELPQAALPLVPGHQIVGVVESSGPGAALRPGERVGVPWLAATCGRCGHCGAGRENLCDDAVFTGYGRDGGYAELAVAKEAYCLALPRHYSDREVAPLLCGGLIGYRALRLAGDAQRVGFFGFGSAAHILTQVARQQGRRIYAFTRPGDGAAQSFAREIGAEWAGGTTDTPPAPLDAAILFAPAGELVPVALRAVGKGGVVVCAGIHMSDVPSFPYELLWGERVLRSVANLTREDGRAFLELAGRMSLRTEVSVYPLEEANAALAALRGGSVKGSAVLEVRGS